MRCYYNHVYHISLYHTSHTLPFDWQGKKFAGLKNPGAKNKSVKTEYVAPFDHPLRVQSRTKFK